MLLNINRYYGKNEQLDLKGRIPKIPQKSKNYFFLAIIISNDGQY